MEPSQDVTSDSSKQSCPAKTMAVRSAVLAIVGICSLTCISIGILSRPISTQFKLKLKTSAFKPGAKVHLLFDRCGQIDLVAQSVSFKEDVSASLSPQSGGGHLPLEYKLHSPTLTPLGTDLLQFSADEDEMRGGSSLALECDIAPTGFFRFADDSSSSEDPDFQVDITNTDLGIWGIDLNISSTGNNKARLTGLPGEYDRYWFNRFEDYHELECEPLIAKKQQSVGVHSSIGAEGFWKPVDLLPDNNSSLNLDQANAQALHCQIENLELNGEAVYTNKYADSVSFQTDEARLDSLRIFMSADGTDHSLKNRNIELSCIGSAKSMKIDGRELVPTLLSDLIGGSGYKRGAVGFAFIFALFAGGILLKRALEVLSEIAIPKPKSEE